MRYTFLFNNSIIRHSKLSVLDFEQLYVRRSPEKFPKKHANEDHKTSWNDLCWFVGIVFIPRTLRNNLRQSRLMLPGRRGYRRMSKPWSAKSRFWILDMRALQSLVKRHEFEYDFEV